MWFSGMKSIKEVILSDGVTAIGSRAFYLCSNLESITIPSSVTTIGDTTFGGCTSLTNVTIPSSVTTIDVSAFSGCSSFTNIVIPNGVEYIYSYTFSGCSNLINVTIPESVTVICDYAFSGCGSLAKIAIPESVAFIGKAAFSGCKSLTDIHLPSSLSYISDNSFEDCSGLANVKIPAGVTSIGNYAFQRCHGLTNISIPEGVTSIGYYAFVGCSSLANIHIPKSVTSIGHYAFASCSSLTRIVLPEGLTRTDGYTFANCTSLTSITIPSSICSIGYGDFYNCDSITKVTSMIIDPPYINEDVFSAGTYNNATLYVLDGSIDAYKNKDSWKKFKNIEELPKTTISIIDESGNDVTSHAAITWYNEDGIIISIGNIVATEKDATVYYSFTLDEKKGRVYREVSHQKAIADGNTVTYQLKPIENVTIHGRVSGLGQGLPRAEVNITQWLNGRYEQTSSAMTDENGYFSIEAKKDSTELYITYHGYLDKKVIRKNFDDGGEFGTIEMEQAKGKVAVINLTYQEAVREGETPIVKNWYDDLRNVAYTVRNVTKGIDIVFAMQQGNIVMPSGVDAGDRIEVCAKSLNDKFIDTIGEGVVGQNDSTAITLNLIQHGGIEVNYLSASESHLQVLVYDASGSMVSRSGFSQQHTTFNGMEAGDYILIIANNSIGNIANLTDLGRMNLSEGSDYIKVEVTVCNAIISVVSVNEKLSEAASQYNLVMANSSYISEKQELREGSYVTLAAVVNFNELYIESINDINLEVDIPNGCKFIKSSVVIGSTVSPYTIRDNRLIVSLTPSDLGKHIRFCVMPQSTGTYTSTALVSFNYNGDNLISIGSASFNVEEGKIAVPEETSSAVILVTGIVPAHANVDIYDNEHLIGSVIAKGDGTFNKHFELFQPYNLSTHHIYANYTTESGTQKTTATHECFYEKAEAMVKSVTMSVYNPEFSRNEEIIFDFENGISNPKSYYFFPYKYKDSWKEWSTTMIKEEKAFTFIADLTTNDTTSIDAVAFYIYTTAKETRVLKGFFNSELARWVAVGNFVAENLPINLMVSLTPSKNSLLPLADTQQATDMLTDLQAYVVTALDEREELDRKEAQIEGEINDGLAQGLPLQTVKELISQYAGFDFDGERAEDVTEENADERMTLLTEQTNSLIVTMDEFLNNGMELYHKYYNAEETLDDGATMTKVVGTCEALTAEELTAKGYQVIPSTEGLLMIYTGDNMLDYVDFHNNIMFTLTGLAQGLPQGDWGALYEAIQNVLEKVMADRDNLNRWLSLAQAERLAIMESLAMTEKEYRSLLAMEANDKVLLLGLNKLEKRRALLISLSLYMGKMNEAVARLNSLIEIYRHIIEIFNRIDNFETGDCVSENNPQTKALLEEMRDNIRKEYMNYVCWRIHMYIARKIMDVNSKRLPRAVSILRILEDAAVTIRDAQFYRYITSKLEQLYALSESAEKACINGGEVYENDKETPQDGQEITLSANDSPDPILPSVTPIHDPSGYVYEAVTSNRLEDVVATVYHQENGLPVQWDAEDFSQVNPIVTDETGLYRWDVPRGMWQVRFEKSGYETTQTDWLPVPPPQMEINMPLSQAVSPVVTDALGVESGITLTFSKYLKPETATTNNMTATKEGNDVSGDIEMVNLEEDPYTGLSFASKVKFVPGKRFNVGDVVLLTVKKEVESYCGAHLAADTTVRVVIQAGMDAIAVDSAANIGYGMSKILNVSITPAEAATGKVVRVVCTSPMIATVDAENVTLDDEGHAKVTVTGKLPGAAALLWSVDGMDLEAITELNVTTAKNDEGDANNDHHVDVADIATILSYMAGYSNISKKQVDMNKDGKVDVADIATVLSIMAEKARQMKAFE